MVAETAGTPLTMAQLRQRMDVSPAAITYLVDRMIDAGHFRRESDPWIDARPVSDTKQAAWNWHTDFFSRSARTCEPPSPAYLTGICLPLTGFSAR